MRNLVILVLILCNGYENLMLFGNSSNILHGRFAYRYDISLIASFKRFIQCLHRYYMIYIYVNNITLCLHDPRNNPYIPN